MMIFSCRLVVNKVTYHLHAFYNISDSPVFRNIFFFYNIYLNLCYMLVTVVTVYG